MAEIKSTGIVSTELGDYITQLEEVFRSALGADLSLESSTPQGQLIGALALTLTEVDELALHVANGLSLHTSIGRQLQDYGTLFSLAKIRGERSTVTATLSGTSGTLIPAGTRAATEENAIFATDAQVLIGSSGTVDVLMRAVELGPTIVAIGSLTKIVDAIPGWLEVTNAAAADIGRNEETDAEYRRRYLSEVSIHGRDSLEAIRARVLSISGVVGCLVRDNPTTASVSTQGINIAARSLLVIVQGGADIDVATAIAATKPVGTPTVGNVAINVPHPQGFNIPIKFRRVIKVPIQVAIDVTVSPSFPSTGFTTMRESLVNWFDGTWPVPGPGIFDQSGIGIGESIDLVRLNTPLNAVPGHKLNSVTVTRKNGNAIGTPNLNQRYTLDSEDISFTVTT